LKFKKSNLIHIQTKDNLVILTHITNTLITLTIFLKKYKNAKGIYIKRRREYYPRLQRELIL